MGAANTGHPTPRPVCHGKVAQSGLSNGMKRSSSPLPKGRPCAAIARRGVSAGWLRCTRSAGEVNSRCQRCALALLSSDASWIAKRARVRADSRAVQDMHRCSDMTASLASPDESGFEDRVMCDVRTAHRGFGFVALPTFRKKEPRRKSGVKGFAVIVRVTGRST
jgi:hypothetical protein